MTQEQKDLLLKDLCARLPYGVKYSDTLNPKEQPSILESIDACGLVMNTNGDSHYTEYIKPYLRPMSSMTEEEENEYRSIDNKSYCCPMALAHIPASNRIDWLNKHQFDHCGLIPIGLAIDATGLNIY